MIVARTIDEARAALRALPRPLGLTPTMGALHEGHLRLVAAAKERCASVAASIFVNPTQFGRGEDFGAYPRDEVRDLALFETTGVEVVFAPTADEMYEDGFATLVHVGGALTEGFEGAFRPGHFDGVAVIVAKLLGVVQPDVLFLGEKDAQQLAVLRRMTRDLDLPVEVAGVPTVREPDGLAMSSRNVYLTAEQRAAAPALHQALLAGRAVAAQAGATTDEVLSSTDIALRRATESAGEDSLFTVDYIAVVDAATFVRQTDLGPRSLLIVAANLGVTRLIDNIALTVPAASDLVTSSSVSAYPAKDATA